MEERSNGIFTGFSVQKIPTCEQKTATKQAPTISLFMIFSCFMAVFPILIDGYIYTFLIYSKILPISPTATLPSSPSASQVPSVNQRRHDIAEASALAQLVRRVSADQDKRYLIGRVSCPRLAGCLINHHLCITVIGADKENASGCLDGFNSTSYAASTVSIALIAADSTPVWPTISGFAKLMMMTSYLPDSIASTSLSHTIGALISGFRS